MFEDFQKEIQKLKAVIVKHENRIRALEAIPTEKHKNEPENVHAGGETSNNNNVHQNKMPDEV